LETIMHDPNLLENLRIIAYLAIVLWFGALIMLLVSNSRQKPHKFNSKDKTLRCLKATLIRAEYNMPFLSLLILIFYLSRDYLIAVILVALFFILHPAIYILYYTKRYWEKD
jgi:hypothetical protein